MTVFVQYISWSPTSTGTIYLNKADFRQEIPYHFNGIDYEGYAAHELGHILGLGDAYLENDDKLVLGRTSEAYAGIDESGNESNIMYENGHVYANDIEMVLEAFSTNEYQFFLDRHNVNYLFYKLCYQSKSKVIRETQKFVTKENKRI